jgi:hypothetical protein
MADMVTVRAKRRDNRVAFWERNAAHPRGEIFISGNGKEAQVARTAAVEEALADGRLVLVQATPVTQQTPPTKTQGDSPFTGLGLTPEQEKALVDAGYADRKALADATDDDLIAVSTIGKATMANLRKALAEK